MSRELPPEEKGDAPLGPVVVDSPRTRTSVTFEPGNFWRNGLVAASVVALGAFLFAGFFDPVTILLLTSVAGVTLLGVGLRLLELKQVRLANFLPALVLAPLLSRLFDAVRAAFQ